MTPLLIKSFRATAAIAAYLIAKSSGDKTVAVASAATDALMGSVGSLGVDSGEMVDFVETGWSEVRAGGNFDFNDPLTADANGKAIKAVVTNATAVRIIGFARAAAAAEDIVPYLVAPGYLTKPSA